MIGAVVLCPVFMPKVFEGRFSIDKRQGSGADVEAGQFREVKLLHRWQYFGGE